MPTPYPWLSPPMLAALHAINELASGDPRTTVGLNAVTARLGYRSRAALWRIVPALISAGLITHSSGVAYDTRITPAGQQLLSALHQGLQLPPPKT